jgi:two-component system, chemotaxis family, chemotaxis protein CheY
LARKILLADDSVTAQNMGRKILADAGYEVITVNNGSAALKKIAETKPDLIVLDVYMPGYSGLEVCQRLKEVKETARIPVLLTVGKLEPFKPEEARRVRAEGYIVKPFEASELLSALSKLEDRVVPRAESAKPGRFARTIAAVEEGRGDESVDASDSADDGWRSRIGFPSKKKKKQDEEETVASRPVNREVRTVVERPVLREINPRQEGRLDVAALAAAAGLPKDVTSEELAALAAAAAQVQAAVDGKEPVAAAPESSFEASTRAAEKAETTVEAQVETTTGSKTESKTESQPEAQAVPQDAQPEASEVGATFARQSVEEAVAAAPVVAAAVNVTAKDTNPATTVRDFEVIATPAVPNDYGAHVNLQAAAGSGNGMGHSQAETEKKETEEKHSDETVAPVTMAAAAGASYIAVGSTTHRWTAVPIAIAVEEAAVSLELEMQKAYAAFAAAEANQPGFVTSPPDAATPVSNSISASIVEAPANPVPDEEEIARTLRDVAPASAEAVDSTLAKLEAVADANVNTNDSSVNTNINTIDGIVSGVTQAEELSARAASDAAAPQAVESVTAPVAFAQAAETHSEIVAAAVRELEAKREQEARELEIRELEAKEREAKELQARELEAKEQDAREQEAREQEGREQAAREQAAREQAEAAAAPEATFAAEAARAAELPASEPISEATSGTSVSASSVSEPSVPVVAEEVTSPSASPIVSTVEPPPTEAVAAVSGAAPGNEKVAGGEMAENRESDLAATTAAAWASWRQIRESGDNKKATGPAKANQQDDDDEEYPELPPDRAAMAAAAGAEKSPSVEEVPEVSADDPEAAIASIVDKVLADLRPKIAEEISRKLKKK